MSWSKLYDWINLIKDKKNYKVFFKKNMLIFLNSRLELLNFKHSI